MYILTLNAKILRKFHRQGSGSEKTPGTLPREERGIGTKAIFPFKGNRLLISLSKRGFYIARHDIRRYETYFSSKISY